MEYKTINLTEVRSRMAVSRSWEGRGGKGKEKDD
jgi:hypothetical protein